MSEFTRVKIDESNSKVSFLEKSRVCVCVCLYRVCFPLTNAICVEQNIFEWHNKTNKSNGGIPTFDGTESNQAPYRELLVTTDTTTWKT